MTALEFLTSFHHARVLALGAEDDILWLLAEADIDGTEPQHYLVMEAFGDARFVQNPPANAQTNIAWHFQHSERAE